MRRRPQTRRGSPALLLSVVLALVTATALLGVGFSLSEPATAVTESATSTRQVERFYTAVDAAIATGDPADLLAALAPGFTVHGSTPDGGRATFIADILALHLAAPDLRLTAEEVIAGRDQAVARVTANGDSGGVPIPDPAVRSRPLDEFRFAGGAITEYRGVAAALHPPQPVFHSTVVTPDGPLLVGVARLVFAPGAHMPAQLSRGPGIFVVEAGAVSLAVDGVARPLSAGRFGEVADGQTYTIDNAGPSGATVLAVGLVPIGAATQARVRNDGMAAVIPVGVAMFLPSAAETAGSPAWPAGIERIAFAGDTGLAGTAGGIDVALERQRLVPGFCVPAVGRPAIVGIEAGLVAGAGGAAVDTSVWGARTIATLPAGSSGVCDAGRTDAVVVIATFVAASAAERPRQS